MEEVEGREEENEEGGGDGEKERKRSGPLDDYFRSDQPCQPLGLQTERF